MTANTLAVRGRYISPAFWTSDDACELPSDSHRVMFIGLWCVCDREGRIEDEPGRIGRRVRSWDSRGAAPLIEHLVTVGMVRRYEVGGVRVLWIPSFKKWQRPHPHEARSYLPPPPAEAMSLHVTERHHTATTEEIGSESTPSTPDVSKCPSEPSEPSEPSGEKPLSSELDLQLVEQPAVVGFTAVFDHWKRVMGHPDAKPIEKRKRAVARRLDEGYTVEQLKQAVDGCALTPHNMGENDRHERYDDLELICRDGAHVERFIRNATSPPKRKGPDPNDDIVRARRTARCAACGAGAIGQFANIDVCAEHLRPAEAEGQRINPEAPWSVDLTQWASKHSQGAAA